MEPDRVMHERLRPARQLSKTLFQNKQGWGYSLVLQSLSNVCKAVDSIPSATTKKKVNGGQFSVCMWK